jgi:hypothetical protein
MNATLIKIEIIINQPIIIKFYIFFVLLFKLSYFNTSKIYTSVIKKINLVKASKTILKYIVINLLL